MAQVFTLETVSLDLHGAVDPSGKKYLGATPAAIHSLYAQTDAAAAKASKAGERWMKKCSSSTSLNCHGIAFKLDLAVNDLTSQFDAWKPYL